MKKSCLSLFFALLIPVFWADAQSISQKVAMSGSSISFTFESQIISTRGSLKTLSGSLDLNEDSLAPLRMILKAKPSDIAFEKLPFEQMLLVTGLLKSINVPEVQFVSDKMERLEGSRFIVSGITDSGRKPESVTFPVDFSKLSRRESIVVGSLYHQGKIGRKNDPRTSILGEASSKASFRLIFR